MTDPVELIEVQVPAEQVRVGDVLVIDTVEHHVEQMILDAVPEYVYAFVPEQVPIPRDALVLVRRVPAAPPSDEPPPAIDPVEYAAVRDLALTLADQLGGKASPTKAAADRVRKAKP